MDTNEALKQIQDDISKFPLVEIIGQLSSEGTFDKLYDAIYNVHENNDQASFKDQFKLLWTMIIDDIWSKPSLHQTPPREATIRLEPKECTNLNLPVHKIEQDAEKPTMYNRQEEEDDYQRHCQTERLESPRLIEKMQGRKSTGHVRKNSAGTAPSQLYRTAEYDSATPLSRIRSTLLSSMVQDRVKRISDFSYITKPTFSFSRCERFAPPANNSPGPGYYQPRPVRDRVPLSTFCTRGKKKFFLQPKKDNPGPATYSPLRHYLAK